MSELEAQMPAFFEEVTKVALLGEAAQIGRRLFGQGSKIHRAMGGGAAGAGAGGILGAGMGAAGGGLSAYEQAKAEGGGGVVEGIQGALSGAGKGALLGAGLGGIGLAGASAASPRVADLAQRLTTGGGPLAPGARFGQRQLHGLTGWTPQGGVRSIRGGAWAPQQRLATAHQKAWASETSPSQAVADAATKELELARRGAQAAEKAEAMGLTSAPGYLKSLAKKPVETARTGFSEQWHGAGPVGKTMIVGLPAATIASEAATSTQPGGKGKAERVGERLGDLAFMAGPLPLSGMLAVGGGLSLAGSAAGRAAGKVQKKQSAPAPPSLEPAGGDTQPTERIVTERAMGLGGMV